MKKILSKFKSRSFWMTFSGAVVMFINCIGDIFGFLVSEDSVSKLVMSLCEIFIILGIVQKDEKKEILQTSVKNSQPTDEKTVSEGCDNQNENEETTLDQQNENVKSAKENECEMNLENESLNKTEENGQTNGVCTVCE